MEVQLMTEPEAQYCAKILRDISFFSSFSREEIDGLVDKVKMRIYEKGEVVFEVGEKANSFYIIFLGTAEVQLRSGIFGLGKKTAELGRGEFFGEMALLDRTTRSATVMAKTQLKAFEISSWGFETLFHKNPFFREQLNKVALMRKLGKRTN